MNNIQVFADLTAQMPNKFLKDSNLAVSPQRLNIVTSRLQTLANDRLVICYAHKIYCQTENVMSTLIKCWVTVADHHQISNHHIKITCLLSPFFYKNIKINVYVLHIVDKKTIKEALSYSKQTTALNFYLARECLHLCLLLCHKL